MPSQKRIPTKRFDVSNDPNMNIEKEKVSAPETKPAGTKILTSITGGKSMGDTDRNVVNDKNVYAVPQGSCENSHLSSNKKSPLTATATSNANATVTNSPPSQVNDNISSVTDAIPTLNWYTVLQDMDSTGKSITDIYEMDGQNILWVRPKQFSLLHAAMYTAYKQNSGIGWKISARLIEIQPLLVKCPLGSSGEYPIVTAIEKYSSGNRKSEFYVFLSCLLRSSLALLPYIPTLIHLAFKKGVPRDIAVYLLRANSKACSVFDDEGFLPLHRLCDTTGVIDTVLLDEVMRIEPRAVVVKTKTMPFLTPMQLLQRNNATISLDESGEGKLSTKIQKKSIDLNGENDQTPLSGQVFHAFANKKSSPKGNTSDPNIRVDGDIKKKEKAEIINLLDDSDDDANDNLKRSCAQPSAESVKDRKSLRSHIKTESPTPTQPRHDSTTKELLTSSTKKEFKRMKTSDLKTQKLMKLQNLEKEIQMNRMYVKKFKVQFENNLSVCRRSSIDVPEQAIRSQALRNLRKGGNEVEGNGGEGNGNLSSIDLSKEKEQKQKQKLDADIQVLELKKHEISATHDKKLSSIRDGYSTKLSTRFKNYRQQIQESQEAHEKELDEVKARIISIQKSIMPDLGCSDGDEMLTIEVESKLNQFIAQNKEIVDTKDAELRKYENRKQELEINICEEVKAFRQKEEDTVKKYSSLYEEKDRNFRKTMSSLYDEIRKVQQAKKNQSISSEKISDDGKECFDKMVPTATTKAGSYADLALDQPYFSQDDLVMKFVAKLRDDVEFLEDSIDSLHRQYEQRKQQKELWKYSRKGEIPNIPNLIKESKVVNNNILSVEIGNDETEVVNIMDVDEDDKSNGSCGTVYEIYERTS